LNQRFKNSKVQILILISYIHQLRALRRNFPQRRFIWIHLRNWEISCLWLWRVSHFCYLYFSSWFILIYHQRLQLYFILLHHTHVRRLANTVFDGWSGCNLHWFEIIFLWWSCSGIDRINLTPKNLSFLIMNWLPNRRQQRLWRLRNRLHLRHINCSCHPGLIDTGQNTFPFPFQIHWTLTILTIFTVWSNLVFLIGKLKSWWYLIWLFYIIIYFFLLLWKVYLVLDKFGEWTTFIVRYLYLLFIRNHYLLFYI
jgi:hypothetical protein